MNFDLHSLIKKIFDNGKSNDLQELLGMDAKYRYIVIDEENDIRDLSNSNIYFCDQFKLLYKKIEYYTEYISEYTIEYNIEDKCMNISILADSDDSPKRPRIAIRGVNDKDRLQIVNYLKQKYGEKFVCAD